MADHDAEITSGNDAGIKQSAVRSAHGDSVEIEQSAVMLARGREIEVEQSGILVAIARSITLKESGALIVLAPRVVGAARSALTLHGLIGLVVGFVLARWLSARTKS